MSRRVVIALLQPVPWHPPGLDPARWRASLAEDLVDLIATLSETDAAIAVPAGDGPLAAAIAWPGMPVYELPAAPSTAAPTAALTAALTAAGEQGYEQAAVLAPDAPDLPALLIGKLLRPLTTRTVAVAPATGPAEPPDGDGPAGRVAGLLGLASRLPPPAWLAGADLDTGSVAAIRAAAPTPAEVASSPGWRRLRGPAALATLDPALEGWEATRALLSR